MITEYRSKGRIVSKLNWVGVGEVGKTHHWMRLHHHRKIYKRRSITIIEVVHTFWRTNRSFLNLFFNLFLFYTFFFYFFHFNSSNLIFLRQVSNWNLFRRRLLSFNLNTLIFYPIGLISKNFLLLMVIWVIIFLHLLVVVFNRVFFRLLFGFVVFGF